MSQELVHTLRAFALAKRGDSDRALREIDRAFASEAPSAELYRLAAKIFASRHDLDKALDWLDRARAAGFGDERTLELRGSLLSRMNLVSGNFEQMELVVGLHPERLESRAILIRACLKLRLFELAREHLEVAIARRPQSARLRLDLAAACIEIGSPELAVEALDRARSLALEPNERNEIALLYIRAGALVRANDASADRAQAGLFALWRGDRDAARAACTDLASSASAELRAANEFVDGQYESALAIAGDELHAIAAAALLKLGRYDEAMHRAWTASSASSDWLPAVELVKVGALAGDHERVGRFAAEELFGLLAPLWNEAPALVGDDSVLAEPVREAISSALERLSGNFTGAFTFVPEGASTWSTFPLKPPARDACVRAFDFIHARPWPWVAERIAALADAYPGSPFPHTHLGELWLWYGDYERCETECRKALALTKSVLSRWAWVGWAASLMCRERHDEALEVFAECKRVIRGPTSAPVLAYRGETLRRAGDRDAAKRDLSEALELAPTRVSAWINLALLEPERKPDLHARLRERLPSFMQDIERDSEGRDVFEHALAVMRGNRSSHRITYFLRDGRCRALPTCGLEPAG